MKDFENEAIVQNLQEFTQMSILLIAGVKSNTLLIMTMLLHFSKKF